MANKKEKHQDNVDGKFYTTGPDDDMASCIACGVCYMGAPEFFQDDEDGNAYVKKQPKTEEEIELCIEQLEACPVESIGDDGDEED